ncbi:hypothetical protein MmiHf6_12280 [Methanimicrococcus hongohii]|uniref:ADP ribosyltransferase domain-containing protein n=1 Tax=Methanimicrococcus hongohii TaxID=3028295 RepID=A0AA96V104_9EURY|nr:ADP-ribosyltransferase [Methanimicrococcus sp. Hf6]WNY23905.1 hypothetical protein MmiHf6_12280 [Methanimicrococcus sp. Hf6]
MLPVEKYFIGCYQDVHFWNDQKSNWSFKVPDSWKDKPWCYAINSKCRFPIFHKNLTYEEKELIDTAIKNLDNAISKSKVRGNPFVYRGVNNIDWLKNPNVGGTFEEKGFGSFSLDINQTYQYTDSENPIIFQLKLNDEMKALYIDGSEREILRPRNTVYKITNIIQREIQISPTLNKTITILKIKEI